MFFVIFCDILSLPVKATCLCPPWYIILFTRSLLKMEIDTCAVVLLSARFAPSLTPLLHLRLPEPLGKAVRWKVLTNDLLSRNEQSARLLTSSSLLSPGNQAVVVSSLHSAFLKNPLEPLSFSGFGIWLLWILDFNESVLAQAFFTLQLLSFIQKPLSGGKNNCSFPFSCRLLAFRTPLRFEKSLDFAYLSYACYGSTWKLQPRSESCAQHSVLKQGHVTSEAKQKRQPGWKKPTSLVESDRSGQNISRKAEWSPAFVIAFAISTQTVYSLDCSAPRSKFIVVGGWHKL